MDIQIDIGKQLREVSDPVRALGSEKIAERCMKKGTVVNMRADDTFLTLEWADGHVSVVKNERILSFLGLFAWLYLHYAGQPLPPRLAARSLPTIIRCEH